MPISASPTTTAQQSTQVKQGAIIVSPPTFSLFSLAMPQQFGLMSLQEEEQSCLKQLFDAYDHAFLWDRFTGVDPEQRRQRKKLSALSTLSRHEPQTDRNQQTSLSELMQRYQVIQAVDGPRTRAMNYYHVARCMWQSSFWQLMSAYGDPVVLKQLQQRYQPVLALAHVPMLGLLHLSTEILPLIQMRLQRHLQELTDKSGYHKPYFMIQYERYLIQTLQQVNQQQQFILQSLATRAVLATYDDLLHHVCEDVLKAITQTPTDTDAKVVFNSLQIIVRKPPRQERTLATQVALYQYLKTPAVKMLPKTGYYQQSLWQALTRYFQADGRYVLLSRRQERLLVPIRLQFYLPSSPGWPSWLWRGRRLRYRFVEQHVAALVDCEQHIADCQQQLQQVQQGKQALSVQQILQTYQHVHKTLQHLKQAAQAQRFQGFSRYWRQRANLFLSAWALECDGVHDKLITFQIDCLESQIAQAERHIHQGFSQVNVQDTQALFQCVSDSLDNMSPTNPELQQRLATIKTRYHALADYGVFYLRQVLQWPSSKLTASLAQSQPATISINGEASLPVTIMMIDNVLRWIITLGKSGQRQTLIRAVEQYVSRYDGSDNMLQSMIMLLDDRALTKAYQQKRLQWLFSQKRYDDILHEPSFKSHQAHIKALLQPQLAQIVQQAHDVDLASLPLVERYARTKDKHHYYRQLLKRVLTDHAFFKKHQTSLESCLRCHTFADMQVCFGIANLREVAQWLTTFIKQYPEQPEPNVLAMIKPYFTSTFVATYGLASTQAALEEIYQQDEKAKQAQTRAKPLIALFDRAVTLAEPLRQQTFKTLLEKLQFTIERQQYSQAVPLQLTAPPECDVLVQHIIQRFIALALSDHSQRYQLFKHFHQNFIEKLPNVVDTDALMTIMINMRRIRPTIAKWMIGLDDVIHQRLGLTLDVNPFVLILLTHLPNNIAKQFIQKIQAALVKTTQNDPLNAVLTACLKTIEDRQCTAHERELCKHFSAFKAVVNTQYCQQLTHNYDHFALEEGEQAALMTTVYGESHYEPFWQRIKKVPSTTQSYAMDLNRVLLQAGYQDQQCLSPANMQSLVKATLLQCLAEPHSQTARLMTQQTQAALALFARHLRQQAGLSTLSPSPTTADHPVLTNGCALLNVQQETHRMVTLVYQVCDECIKTVQRTLSQTPIKPRSSRWCYFTRSLQASSTKHTETIQQLTSLLQPLQTLAEQGSKENTSLINDFRRTIDPVIERLPTLKLNNRLQTPLLNVLQSSRTLISPDVIKTHSPHLLMQRR